MKKTDVDVTAYTRGICIMLQALDFQAADPSVVVQRRKNGVRVVACSRFLNGQNGGFVAYEKASTVEEALLLLHSNIRQYVKSLIGTANACLVSGGIGTYVAELKSSEKDE